LNHRAVRLFTWVIKVDFNAYSTNYLAELKTALSKIPQEEIAKLTELLAKVCGSEKQVFVFGNGGSAATASHFANDLAKGAISCEGKRFRVLSLSDSIPLMLAWANDSHYDDIFVEQLKNFLNPGDIVIGISGSGNSNNVLKAIEYANEKRGISVGLTGMGGGKLKKLAQIPIVVESNHMGMVEDVHLTIVHLISYYLGKVD